MKDETVDLAKGQTNVTLKKAPKAKVKGGTQLTLSGSEGDE